jgi:uncharacterized protein
MNKLISILVLACLFAGVSQAQDNGLLYEVSGKDLAQPSYLYGTFHLVCSTDVQLTDATRRSLAAARQLYLELDFDDPSLQMTMMGAMRLDSGKNIKDLLKPDDYAVLDAYLVQNLGLGLALMGTLKPIALVTVVYGALLRCQPASYDAALAEIATKDKKSVLGLETVQEQLAVIDKIPLEQQLEELVDVARKPEDARKELMSLIASYKAHNLPQLMKALQSSEFVAETAGLEQELLDKRNSNWIPIIEKAAREKSTFFAFGAGHLGGEKGVLNLLRLKGYSVKAIN